MKILENTSKHDPNIPFDNSTLFSFSSDDPSTYDLQHYIRKYGSYFHDFSHTTSKAMCFVLAPHQINTSKNNQIFDVSFHDLYNLNTSLTGLNNVYPCVSTNVLDNIKHDPHHFYSLQQQYTQNLNSTNHFYGIWNTDKYGKIEEFKFPCINKVYNHYLTRHRFTRSRTGNCDFCDIKFSGGDFA